MRNWVLWPRAAAFFSPAAPAEEGVCGEGRLLGDHLSLRVGF